MTINYELRKFVSPEFIFGIDAIKLSGKYAQNFAAQKALIVSDKGVANHGWLSKVEHSVKDKNISYCCFTEITENPKDYEVMAGADFYKSEKCDIIIAVGGGSVIDCAKGIAIVSTNGGNILDYEGVDSVNIPIPPLICIPTTAGSSADVSQFAIINDTSRRLKVAIISKTIIPDVSLIDPITTTTMNVELTVYTGMDALCHAFEAFASNANSPITDLFALKAIEIIYSNLHKAISKLTDIKIRSSMMLGSLYAGLAFSNASLGLVHAMAHSAGGLLDLPHGCCNTNLLPYVVSYNFDAIPSRYRQIARLIGINEKDLTDELVCNELIDSLFNLIKQCGLEKGLCQNKIEIDTLEKLADNALKDPCLATNPKIPSKEDIVEIYAKAN